MAGRMTFRWVLDKEVAAESLGEVRRGAINIHALSDDGQGKTLLMLAAYHWMYWGIGYLVNAGLNASARDRLGRTALFFATVCRCGEVETCSCLSLTIEALQEAGLDVEQADDKGTTLLMSVVETGHVDMADALLDAGADVNSKDKCGRSPLMYAAYADEPSTTLLLLHKGADIFERDDYGRSVLMWATLNTCIRSDNLKGMETLAVDEDFYALARERPTFLVRERGDSLVMTELIRHGAYVNAADDSGWTALMIAAEAGNLPITTLLVEKGADVHARDDNGKTALMYAIESGAAQVAEYLRGVA